MSVSPMFLLTLFCGFAVGWLLGEHPTKSASKASRIRHRVIFGVIAATIVGLMAGMIPPSEPPEWTEAVTQIANSEQLDAFYAMAGSEPVIVDFYADWCGPCRVTAPHAIAAAEEGMHVAVVDVDVAQDVAWRYQVELLPTVMVVREGAIVHRTYGVYSLEDLRTMVASAKAPAAS